MLAERIRLEEDYYRSELLKMEYYKTPDGKQLWELNHSELEQIYENERFKSESKK